MKEEVREVIILGYGSTRVECPYDKETWGVNGVYAFAKRLDKLFIIDKITPAEFHIDLLKKLPCIVASVPYPEFSNIEVYPIKEVLARFKTRFFSNTIAYMIAYALLYGYEKIRMYGIDMMTHSTYVFEKGGVEYWMGYANGLGVPVINTNGSATGKTYDGKMYGCWPQIYQKVNRPESLAEESRQLVQTIPGIVDESEEWDRDSQGNWVRKEQKLRKTVLTHDAQGKITSKEYKEVE